MQNVPTVWSPFATASPSPRVSTRSELAALPIPVVQDGILVFCAEAGFKSYYYFDYSSGLPVDGVSVLPTSRGGASRWVAASGSVFSPGCGFDIRNYGGKADSFYNVGTATWSFGTDNSGPLFDMISDMIAKGYGGGIGVLPFDPRTPGGVYGFGSGLGTFVLNNPLSRHGFRLHLEGCAGAAPIALFPGVAGQDWLGISGNLSECSFSNMTFLATNPSLDNCNRLFTFSGNTIGTYNLEKIVAYGIAASGNNLGLIYHSLAHMNLHASLFVGCSAPNGPNAGVIMSDQSLGFAYSDVQIITDDALHDIVYSTAAESAAGISILGEGGYSIIGGAHHPHTIEQVNIGFNYRSAIKAEGIDATNRIRSLFMEKISLDVGNVNYLEQAADPGAGIDVRFCDHVDIHGARIGGSAFPLANAARFRDAGNVYLHDILCARNGAAGAALDRSANRIIVDEITKSVVLEDCEYFWLDAKCAHISVRKNGVETEIAQDASMAGRLRMQTIDEAFLANVAPAGTGTIDVQVLPDATSRFHAKVDSYDPAQDGLGLEQRGSFTLDGTQSTLEAAVAGSANPASYGDNVSDAAFGGAASTLVWTPGAGANSRNGRLTVTNGGAAAETFLVEILKRISWGTFSPAQIADSPFGNFVVEIFDGTSLVQAGGAVTDWLGRLGRFNLTQANAGLRPAYAAGPPAEAQFTGGQRLEGVFPASTSAYSLGTVLVSGTCETDNSTLVSMSSSAVGLAAGAVQFVQRAAGLRLEVTGGAGIANLAVAADLNYHKFAAKFFEAQSKVYRDAAASDVANPQTVPVAGNSVFVGQAQGGADALTGKIRGIVFLSQMVPDELVSRIQAYMP